MMPAMETFVVRAWRAAAHVRPDVDDAAHALRGVVEHIGSGDSIPFRDADELVQFLVGQADDRGVESDRRR
jgi:hypothetical protein